MLLDLVAQWLVARRVPTLAKELAEAVVGPVRHAVGSRAGAMPRAEAMGYIRGKATPIIDDYLAIALRTKRGVSSTTRLQLVEEVSDRVVRLVLEDVLRAKWMPAPVRRAA